MAAVVCIFEHDTLDVRFQSAFTGSVYNYIAT